MSENKIYGKIAQAVAEIQSADWTPDGSFDIPNKNSAHDTKVSYVTLRKIKYTIAPILAKHGLIVVYDYDKPEWLPPASQLKPSHVLIRLVATIYDEDGNSVSYTVYGEGGDKGEKAVSFQRAYALRSFYQDAFHISDYLEPEEVESERTYIRQSEQVPVLIKKAVPEEKPSVTVAQTVNTDNAPAPSSATSVAKPLSAIQRSAIENMRTTIKDKVANGSVKEQDGQLTLNALDGIKDADMFQQFLRIKGDYYL